MSRTKKDKVSKDMKETRETSKQSARTYRKRSNKKDSHRGDSEERDVERGSKVGGLIPMKNGDRNPNWYFTDKAMAEQVTQMAFQNLAGYPIEIGVNKLDVPNVNTIFLNPAPGVINTADYGSTLLNKTAGINLAGFKFFSELAAYTGRSAIYGPQDISTMILGLGELLSMMEVIRRMFGVAFTMNMRNRSYPREVLAAMYVDPDDIFDHFSDYRTRYNTLVTMVNQIPIPATIAYLDKCQRIYEEIYLDTESSMAQTLIPMPFTTWVMDETSYSGGTILATEPVCCAADKITPLSTLQPLSYFLDIADKQIGALLNSSTLNVVYTDILNLATKKGVAFLKMDYLAEGYAVVPRYSQEFMLQMHNSTLIGQPVLTSLIATPVHATPYNDVYPNANTNSLYYNPGFGLAYANPDVPRTGSYVLVDLLSDNPDVVDRIEVLRYASLGAQNIFTSGGNKYCCDAVVPDHYIVGVKFWTPSGTISSDFVNTTQYQESIGFKRLASLVANIDWAPRFYEYSTSTGLLTGNYTGDVNFYTTIDSTKLTTYSTRQNVDRLYY